MTFRLRAEMSQELKRLTRIGINPVEREVIDIVTTALAMLVASREDAESRLDAYHNMQIAANHAIAYLTEQHQVPPKEALQEKMSHIADKIRMRSLDD